MSNLPVPSGKILVPVVAMSLIFFSIRVVTYGSCKAALGFGKTVVTNPPHLEVRPDIKNPADGLNSELDKLNKVINPKPKIDRIPYQDYIPSYDMTPQEEKQLAIPIINRKFHWNSYSSAKVNKDLCYLSKLDICYGNSNNIDLEVICNNGRSARLKRRIIKNENEYKQKDADDEYIVKVNSEYIYDRDHYYYAMDSLDVLFKRHLFTGLGKKSKRVIRDTFYFEPDSFIGSLLSVNRRFGKKSVTGDIFLLDDVTICKKGPLVYPTFKIKKNSVEIVIQCKEKDIDIEVIKS